MIREREHFEIKEHCEEIHERDGWHCQFPNCRYTDIQVAHRICQKRILGTLNDWNTQFKEERNYQWIRAHVIHHPLNVVTSCAFHNSKFNIAGNPGKVAEKLNEIRKNLIQRGVIK